MRCTLILFRALAVAPLVIGMVFFVGAAARAFEILGTGTGSLLGGDLTDPEDDGDPEADEGYNAVFDASHEPGFGSENAEPSPGNGESAFNVFDNLLGPANDKWCCGPLDPIPDDGLWVTAQFDQPYLLTHFTVSSANDAPARDPTVWAVQGSNDGVAFTDIYTYDDFSPWDERLQVIQFSAPEDFPVQTTGYSTFRFVTFNTDSHPAFAYFQVGEIEYFGEPGGGGALQAGDADMDLDFDQLDLVRVQIAAKYLTGPVASWGEGDWNGAPGGSPGNPPAGDSRFNQSDIISALTAGKYLTGKYAALANANGMRGDGQTSIIYNAGTGEVAVDAPAGTNLTSVNIESAGRIFTGAPATNLGGSFDNDSDNNIFKATFGSSFGSLSFGNVAQAGLSQQFVLNDLTVVGSLAGGGALGNVDLIYVPEPASALLLLIGFVFAIAQRRRTRPPFRADISAGIQAYR